MPAPQKVELSADQRKKLRAWTKNPPKPYLRRKAWAILLSAEGRPAYQVAADRRVRAHRTSVSGWIKDFKLAGSKG